MPIKPENKKLYPKNWAEISRDIRFNRAGGRCEFDYDGFGNRCQARHGQPHPITGSKVVLTVAHLDHDPTNCAPENLLAGCQKCHLAYDQKHHEQTRLEGLRCKKTTDLFQNFDLSKGNYD